MADLMPRGAHIAQHNNVATYFGVVPGTFAGADPVLAALNVMGTATWSA